MKQSKVHSLLEQIMQAVLKFGTAMLCWQLIVGPLMGIPLSFGENFKITFIMFLNSIVFGYFIRRSWNWWHHKHLEN